MQPANDSSTPRLCSTFLHTYWLFQAIFAGPISAALALSAFVRLLNTHGPIYDFVTQVCNAILAGAIVFTVLIQQRMPVTQVSKALTLRFEIAKSVLATILWIWLMMDAAFGPQNEYDYYKRRPRVISAAVSSVVLVYVKPVGVLVKVTNLLARVLFYPTVVFATQDTTRRAGAGLGVEDSSNEVVERTPLL